METIARAKMNKTKKTNNKGMVSVEVIISFTCFIVVVAGIIYFTNIFIVHNKVQFALNSAAHEVATYTYFYQALGARNAEKQLQNDLGDYAENIDDTVSQVADTVNEISTFYDNSNSLINDAQTVTLDSDYISQIENDINILKQNGNDAYESGKESATKIQGLFEDPNGTIVGIIYMITSGVTHDVKSYFASVAAKAMTKKYLNQGELDADSFLKKCGVKDGYDGLDFSGSTMFCDAGGEDNPDGDFRMIDFVVEYDIHIGFLGLILPDPTVHMVQRVSVSAWVGDNGMEEHYEYLSPLKEHKKTKNDE